MNKLITIAVLLACSSLLASCEFLRNWADASEPAAPSAPPTVPDAGVRLPEVGGADPLDVLVTVLSLLGLAPAARIVSLARPLIAPMILAIIGRKKKDEPAQPASPA